jgi:hypothetical protein
VTFPRHGLAIAFTGNFSHVLGALPAASGAPTSQPVLVLTHFFSNIALVLLHLPPKCKKNSLGTHKINYYEGCFLSILYNLNLKLYKHASVPEHRQIAPTHFLQNHENIPSLYIVYTSPLKGYSNSSQVRCYL